MVTVAMSRWTQSIFTRTASKTFFSITFEMKTRCTRLKLNFDFFSPREFKWCSSIYWIECQDFIVIWMTCICFDKLPPKRCNIICIKLQTDCIAQLGEQFHLKWFMLTLLLLLFLLFFALSSIGIIFCWSAFAGWCSASTSTQLMSLSELVFKSFFCFISIFVLLVRALCKCKNKRIINVNSAAHQWCNNLWNVQCAIAFGARIKNYTAFARARFCFAVACFLSPCSCCWVLCVQCAVCTVHCWVSAIIKCTTKWLRATLENQMKQNGLVWPFTPASMQVTVFVVE